MIGINEAIDLATARITSSKQSEKVPLPSALGRILSSDISALKNLPCFDNSALDGYAYAAEFKDEELKIVEPTIFAGDEKFYEIKAAQAQKIMTGAPMPAGADSVARLEDVDVQGGTLKIPASVHAHDGFRKKGEEVRAGELLLRRGEILSAAKIMLLAAQGIYEASVYAHPKIALFSSGNELKEPWQDANEREIYNANASGIAALLSAHGFESEYLGILKDDLCAVKDALLAAAQRHDVIITSGGASAGEADFMRQALASAGFNEVFSHVDIKPGKPTKCYEKDGKFVFVAAGNPMAAFVLTRVLVLPLLLKMCGAGATQSAKCKDASEARGMDREQDESRSGASTNFKMLNLQNEDGTDEGSGTLNLKNTASLRDAREVNFKNLSAKADAAGLQSESQKGCRDENGSGDKTINDTLFCAIQARLAKELKLRPGRVNLIIGAYRDGEFMPIESSSGMIRPLSLATHFFLSEPQQTRIERGESVKIYEI